MRLQKPGPLLAPGRGLRQRLTQRCPQRLGAQSGVLGQEPRVHEERALDDGEGLELLHNLPPHLTIWLPSSAPEVLPPEELNIALRDISEVPHKVQELMVAHEVHHAAARGGGQPPQLREQRVEVAREVAPIDDVTCLHQCGIAPNPARAPEAAEWRPSTRRRQTRRAFVALSEHLGQAGRAQDVHGVVPVTVQICHGDHTAGGPTTRHPNGAQQRRRNAEGRPRAGGAGGRRSGRSGSRWRH
mmetsp:Transcript_166353/g.534341  ORF Transcript_166353/g.534341 Transcript_166353/m.534341 type:complete len:243 (+) Transcript_166353:512-1240(+)